jgi:hypothetical protein
MTLLVRPPPPLHHPLPPCLHAQLPACPAINAGCVAHLFARSASCVPTHATCVAQLSARSPTWTSPSLLSHLPACTPTSPLGPPPLCSFTSLRACAYPCTRSDIILHTQVHAHHGPRSRHASQTSLPACTTRQGRIIGSSNKASQAQTRASYLNTMKPAWSSQLSRQKYGILNCNLIINCPIGPRADPLSQLNVTVARLSRRDMHKCMMLSRRHCLFARACKRVDRDTKRVI